MYKLYRLERVTADLCQKEPSIFYLRVTKNTSNMPVESISSYRFYELFLLINNSKSVYNWKLSFIYHIFSWEKKWKICSTIAITESKGIVDCVTNLIKWLQDYLKVGKVKITGRDVIKWFSSSNLFNRSIDFNLMRGRMLKN